MHTLQSYRSFEEKIKEFYEFFPEKLEEGMRMTAEKLISEALKEEIDIYVDAERYERCTRRRALRNGHYERRTDKSVWVIEDTGASGPGREGDLPGPVAVPTLQRRGGGVDSGAIFRWCLDATDGLGP
jgi:hypothetical protein